MEIKKIKKLSSGKYQLDISNGEKIITYDEVILKYNLLYKKELSSNDLNEINKSNDYYAVYNNAVKYLTKKIHSKKEFIRYIDKYELNGKELDRLIKELEDLKLLDDNKFLKAFISDRFYLTSDGPIKIKKALLEQGLDEFLIDNELAKIDEEAILEKVKRIIAKKMKIAKGSSYLVRQKIYQDMYNLGYSKTVVDECFIDDIDESSSLEKDFNKYYNQYSKKEKDIDKLNLKIKQKLYQKGYNLSKIDEIINKKRNS